MNTRSSNRSRQERDYAALREQFLTDNPSCKFPLGCSQPATTVQHLRGRQGWRLLYVPWWAPSCLAHNLWAEDNPARAYEIGWKVRTHVFGEAS